MKLLSLAIFWIELWNQEVNWVIDTITDFICIIDGNDYSLNQHTKIYWMSRWRKRKIVNEVNVKETKWKREKASRKEERLFYWIYYIFEFKWKCSKSLPKNCSISIECENKKTNFSQHSKECCIRDSDSCTVSTIRIYLRRSQKSSVHRQQYSLKHNFFSYLLRFQNSTFGSISTLVAINN